MPLIPGILASALISKTLAPVAGYNLWLDAADASTFTYSSGSVVSQWTDKSANGYTFTQSTVANQPTRTGTQNGKSTLVFDGSNDVLASTAASSVWKFLHDGSGATAFVVAKQTRTTTFTNNRVLATVNYGTTSEIGVVVGLNTVSPATQIARSTVVVSGASPSLSNTFFDSTYATSHAVQSIVFDESNATDTNREIQYLNNGSANLANTNTFAPSSSNPTATLQLGNDGVNYAPLQGEIAEIIIYPSILSDTNRNAVISYLMFKWGIS